MSMINTGTRLYFPVLQSIYDRLSPLSWPLVRIAAGLILIPHGIPKIFGTFAPVLATRVLEPMGVPFPLFMAYFLGSLEIVGGALLAAGFLTRLLALMFTVEMAVIFFFVSLPKGWIYSVPGGGAEFPGFLLIVYLAIFLAGAGAASIDRWIGREL